MSFFYPISFNFFLYFINQQEYNSLGLEKRKEKMVATLIVSLITCIALIVSIPTLLVVLLLLFITL